MFDTEYPHHSSLYRSASSDASENAHRNVLLHKSLLNIPVLTVVVLICLPEVAHASTADKMQQAGLLTASPSSLKPAWCVACADQIARVHTAPVGEGDELAAACAFVVGPAGVAVVVRQSCDDM